MVLAETVFPCGRTANPWIGGYIVPRASHRRITPTACLGKVLLVEQQAPSLVDARWSSHLHRFRSHVVIVADFDGRPQRTGDAGLVGFFVLGHDGFLRGVVNMSTPLLGQEHGRYVIGINRRDLARAGSA